MFNERFSKITLVVLILFFVAGNFQLVADDAPQKGFKITKDTVLDLGITLTPEFESNTTKASEETVTVTEAEGVTTEKKAEIISDLILHYAPSIRIKLDDSDKTVGFGVYFDYNHYLGIEDSGTSKKLSELDLKATILGEFNKSGLVIFEFKDTLSRSSSPDGQELSGKHRNLQNAFETAVSFKNPADTLFGKISLGVDLSYYEDSKDREAMKDYNYVSPMANFFGRWKFLPRTMAFTTVSVRYQDYYESSIRSAARSIPFNVFLGLMGQVSQHISSKVSVGYTGIFGEAPRHDYNANLEMVFKHEKGTYLAIGYLRNVKPSATYSWSGTHKVYLNFNQKFAKVFLAAVNFSYSYLNYGKSIEYSGKDEWTAQNDGSFTNDIKDDAGTIITKYEVVMPQGRRADHLIQLTPSFSYNILAWLGLKLSYIFEYKDTDYYKKTVVDYLSEGSKVTTTSHYDYIDHRVLLSVVLDY